MRQIKATDILNLETTKEEKLRLLKLWLTTEVGMFTDKPKLKSEYKWWQFIKKWHQFRNRPTRDVET